MRNFNITKQNVKWYFGTRRASIKTIYIKQILQICFFDFAIVKLIGYNKWYFKNDFKSYFGATYSETQLHSQTISISELILFRDPLWFRTRTSTIVLLISWNIENLLQNKTVSKSENVFSLLWSYRNIYPIENPYSPRGRGIGLLLEIPINAFWRD